MATTAINTELPTLLDLVKMRGPDGATLPIVEALQRRNAVLEDAMFMEGNLPTGHVFSTRTGLPGIGWRRFNEGVAASKSRKDQITETCGMMSGISKVDAVLANVGGNAAAFRMAEDKAFVQSFNHEFETGIFYHSTKTAPEKLNGFSPRLDATTNPYGRQIIDWDGSSSGNDQTSMWLVVWGPDTVFCITPKGSPSGLKPTDMGEQLVQDENGREYRALVTTWDWSVGLCVKDARYLVRLANVDTSAIVGTDETLITSMVKMVHQAQDLKSGRPVIYCNRTLSTYLHLQARKAVANSTLKVDQVEGQPVLSFMGIPVRMTDALLNTESVVS